MTEPVAPVLGVPNAFKEHSLRKRIEFVGPTESAQFVRIQLWMLKQLALDPRDCVRNLDAVKQGVVNLNFFGVSNPVPFFEVDPASEDGLALQEAIVVNIASPMMDAAQRVRKRRNCLSRRRSQEDAVLDQLRKTLHWPTQPNGELQSDELQK